MRDNYGVMIGGHMVMQTIDKAEAVKYIKALPDERRRRADLMQRGVGDGWYPVRKDVT